MPTRRIPVLVKVGENCRIDMEEFTAKLTPDISAVIVSQMRGYTSDTEMDLAYVLDSVDRALNAQAA